jgi:hypothetical protein
MEILKKMIYNKSGIQLIAISIIIQAINDLHIINRKEKYYKRTAYVFFNSKNIINIKYKFMIASIAGINDINAIYKKYKTKKHKKLTKARRRKEKRFYYGKI